MDFASTVPKPVGAELVSAQKQGQTQGLPLRKLGFQNISNKHIIISKKRVE